MTFDLKVITIETKPRAGYFILDEGEFSTVKRLYLNVAKSILIMVKYYLLLMLLRKLQNLSVKLLLNKRIMLLQNLFDYS